MPQAEFSDRILIKSADRKEAIIKLIELVYSQYQLMILIIFLLKQKNLNRIEK